jgi:hypothetical protein
MVAFLLLPEDYHAGGISAAVVLGAVLLYQLTLWHHAIADRNLRQGLKPFLLSA